MIFYLFFDVEDVIEFWLDEFLLSNDVFEWGDGIGDFVIVCKIVILLLVFLMIIWSFFRKLISRYGDLDLVWLLVIGIFL